MDAGPAVVVRGLWEEFTITQDRALSVKEVISRFRFARGRTTVSALRDVSFEVKPGETVGLIGENGSGKSTLLRCIAGIIPPTRGDVLVRGTVSSLIELGAGFHPELTGRENFYITGALFGLSRRTLEKRLNSVVEFAELGEVMDRPVRSYSSGMAVRLAFSLAVHVEPDVLLIDEVLAVGDEAFQRKCLERILDLTRQAVTVLFVSHSLATVRKVASRSILLHHGELIADGPSGDVIDRYLELLHLPASPVRPTTVAPSGSAGHAAASTFETESERRQGHA